MGSEGSFAPSTPQEYNPLPLQNPNARGPNMARREMSGVTVRKDESQVRCPGVFNPIIG